MFTSHFFKHLRPICKLRLFSVHRRCFSDEKKPYDPLRILFCGADEFSIYSLRAVQALKEQKPECVSSIDVVCRPDKRVGRGLKKIQEGAFEEITQTSTFACADLLAVPVKSVAKELDLPIHQIDTFTGWTSPSPVDLVIAVSFGLLVPSRILKGATYGGLNVHPSLLPDLRGPAPIQHALMKGRTHTGVSLQTMHPSRFDHGMILAQTLHPGYPIPEDCTPEHLVEKLGQLSAEMLVKGIEEGVFVSPTPAVNGADPEGKCEHAPKIQPEDRHICWSNWTADRIMRYDRAIGRLWDATTYQRCYAHKGDTSKRVTFHGPWRQVSDEQVHEDGSSMMGGQPVLCRVNGSKQRVLAMRTVDGNLLSPESVTIEGEQKGKGLASLIPALRTSSKL